MYENVKEYLDWARDEINLAIEKEKDELQKKFLLDVEDVFKGGKRFRPSLTLLVSQAIGGDDAWKNAMDYALSVELIHSFSLNIDDILDLDKVRRGKPSEWVTVGLLPAFLVGIGGITQAFALGSKNHKAMQILNETIQSMASGAVKEMVSGNAFRRDLLLNIIILKTGALMATATQMGAVAVNAPSHIEERFRKYGLNLGIAYQLQDDLNDLVESLRDYTPHGDLRDLRLTMPLYILHQTKPNLSGVIDMFLSGKVPFKELADAMMSVGGANLFGGIRNDIDNYIEKSILQIKDLSLHEKYRDILFDIPYYMVDAMREEIAGKWNTAIQKTAEYSEKEPENIEKSEKKEPTLTFDEWFKSLPPSQIAAVSLIRLGLDDEEVIEKTNITEKELSYIKKILEKYKE